MTQEIALFASGSGSNVENIIKYFQNQPSYTFTIYTNRKDALVLERAKRLQTEAVVFSKAEFQNPEVLCKQLQAKNTQWIVLAGFLWLIPAHFVSCFPNKIVNIHPSLLPDFGGKGMFGAHVHQAVIAAKRDISGITIHLVDEKFDHGQHVFQAQCPVLPTDDAESLAKKIHALEYAHFPPVLEKLFAQG